MPVIELGGVNKIVVYSELSEMFEKYKTTNWSLIQKEPHFALYANKQTNDINRVFSYVPQGVQINDLKVKRNEHSFSLYTNKINLFIRI